MEQYKIERINALAWKARTQGLSAWELAERDALRREYIASVVGNLKEQLDNTYLVDEHGNRRKLPRKGG